METDVTQKVMDFYAKDGDERVLEGKVWIQGTRIEVRKKRITRLEPLYFKPQLADAITPDRECLQILLRYLQSYQPIDTRGLVFFPTARFSLHTRGLDLGLYLQEEKNWGQAEAIDIFNRQTCGEEFEEIVRLMQENKTSSFVLGRLRERKDYDCYTVLRRHFNE